jgi:dolichol-phosphate mannosyltransferase
MVDGLKPRPGWQAMNRFLQFCLVGASGVLVDMGLLALVLAKAIACEIAIVNNFLWNDHWTFRGVEPAQGRGARFLWFNGVSLAGLALNVALFAAQVRWLGMNLYLANAVAIIVVAGFNYTLSQQWAWRTASPREAE